jgi:hypothetical protein
MPVDGQPGISGSLQQQRHVVAQLPVITESAPEALIFAM